MNDAGEDLSIDLWEIDDDGAAPVAADAAAKAPEEEKPVYPTLNAFVADHLSPLIRRRLNGSARTWCPAWWRHAEAISRLDAVWRAWEHLRQDPLLGMSTWWLYHCDPHLTVLMDADNGPLAACTTKNGHTDRPFPPLPLETPDPKVWAGSPFKK
jgi:hypothetical protein